MLRLAALGLGLALARTLTKQSLAAYPGAVCLDGTPGVYYVDRNTDSKNWLIHYEGGGWCKIRGDEGQGNPAEPCKTRATTGLGSSKDYPASLDRPADYFSTDPATNPTFYDWNIVFIRYCDGGSYSGTRNCPGQQEDPSAPFNFCGHYISRAVMQDVMQMSIGKNDEPDNIVVSGCSAGGLASYLHVDDWAIQWAIAPRLRATRGPTRSKTRIIGMPDSGFFFDSKIVLPPQSPGVTMQSYHTIMKNNFVDFGAEGGVNADCVAYYKKAKNDASDCYFAQYTAPFIRSPVFALQSPFDDWQLGCEIQRDAPDAQKLSYGQGIEAALNAFLFNDKSFPRNENNGGFLNSCQYHGGGWGLQMHHSGKLISMARAFDDWFRALPQQRLQRKMQRLGASTSYDDNTAGRYWDELQKYPCPECCSDRSKPESLERLAPPRADFCPVPVQPVLAAKL